ncbi:nuclear transport factor 2 family protein [candidate division KSB1 bacterium]|nr:nuclear transport factor 2 family protein [candidate division KSB1 bacterium]
MKNFKITLSVLLVLCMILLLPRISLSQEWSEQQKTVWEAVKANWQAIEERNLEKFLNDLHPDFMSWNYIRDLPQNKDSQRKWNRFYFENEKMLVYEITPVAIQIIENTAVAHYYFYQIIEDAEGKKQTRKGRWTDILIKKDDKWIYIGWYGGVVKQN